MNAGRHVTGWLRSEDASLKEDGKLQGAPHRRQFPPLLGPGEPSSKLRRVGRSTCPKPRGAARVADARIGMPSGEAFRAVQHTAGADKPSVGAWNGYPYVVVLLRPSSHLEPDRNRYTMLRRPPPLPHVRTGRLGLDARPPSHLKSLIAKVSPAVTVDGRWCGRTPGGWSAIFLSGGTFSDGASLSLL